MEYSPFQKKLDDLTVEDLSVLKTVSEGWYVEYKRQITTSDSIAKSLSAFGNTYGGWLFFGVEEKSNTDPVAESVPGIPASEVDGAIQKIRQAASTHVSPSVSYDLKVLKGVNADVGLEEGFSVICVWVPMSWNAPLIHKNGRVYRRVADSSEPTHENDKYSLDKLWERTRDIDLRYKEWHDADPSLNEAEKKYPFIRLMITPFLYDAVPGAGSIDLAMIREKFGARATKNYNHIPFDTVYATADGYIARQCKGNDPSGHVLSWRIKNNLSSEVLVPLTPIDLSASVDEAYYQYANFRRFERVVRESGNSLSKLVDLNYLYLALTAIVDMQADLQRSLGIGRVFYVKAKVLNCERLIPFLDVDHHIDDMLAYGLPVCLDQTVTAPAGFKPSTFMKCYEFDGLDEDQLPIFSYFLIFTLISRALGITAYFEFDDANPDLSAYAQAGVRAKSVQIARLD